MNHNSTGVKSELTGELVNRRDSLTWSVRLSSNEPAKVVAVYAVAVLAFLFGLVLLKSLLLGIAGLAIVIGATMEYLVGATYKVDQRGASSRCGLSVTSMEWTEVKRIIESPEGVRLSPFQNAGTRDAFRGVFLRYGAENRETVMKFIRGFLPANVRLHE